MFQQAALKVRMYTHQQVAENNSHYPFTCCKKADGHLKLYSWELQNEYIIFMYLPRQKHCFSDIANYGWFIEIHSKAMPFSPEEDFCSLQVQFWLIRNEIYTEQIIEEQLCQWNLITVTKSIIWLQLFI